LDLYTTLSDKQVATSISLGILRSDYMLHTGASDSAMPKGAPGQGQGQGQGQGHVSARQIEINTIASSFGCLSHRAGDLHRFLLEHNTDSSAYRAVVEDVCAPLNADLAAPDGSSGGAAAAARVEDNPSIRMLAFAIAMAHTVYGTPAAKVRVPFPLFLHPLSPFLLTPTDAYTPFTSPHIHTYTHAGADGRAAG
jgi:hypothetical protein